MLEHLSSGLPTAAKALREFKASFGRYWLEIAARETKYREEVECLRTESRSSANLNDSHFFRSILSEVDKKSQEQGHDDYLMANSPEGALVAFD
ncbi:MAG: hypothetical protein QGI09_01950, partial [Dehalococcoidia bacterium]|nr:hypothetical protein [Dehalococcoidia bacterium]